MSDFEAVVNLATNRGFVFSASSIYGGLRSSYDFGPLGALLKKNIADSWWKSTVSNHSNIYPVDTAIIQSPDVWKASGHISEFSDPLVECEYCNRRYRLDSVDELLCDNEECKEKGPNFSKPKEFNLMFETHMGPIQDDDNLVYLRPETAQGIFINFSNVLRTTRAKLPFGIANIGKSFRNEITPGQFIFRTREFEQMELEFFCTESEEEEWFKYWIEKRFKWYLEIGIIKDNIRIREHDESELSHYSKYTSDIEYNYPWGWGELEGIANRGTYDLQAHIQASSEDLTYFDDKSNQKLVPSVIEPAAGLTRTFFAVLLDAYTEEKVGDDKRIVLKLDKNIAPIKVAILPLSKKQPLIDLSNEINSLLSQKYSTEVDITQSIGKRYRRQDEIGTPYCLTVDFDSLKDGMVTIRDRDSMEQERVKVNDLMETLEKYYGE